MSAPARCGVCGLYCAAANGSGPACRIRSYTVVDDRPETIAANREAFGMAPPCTCGPAVRELLDGDRHLSGCPQASAAMTPHVVERARRDVDRANTNALELAAELLKLLEDGETPTERMRGDFAMALAEYRAASDHYVELQRQRIAARVYDVRALAGSEHGEELARQLPPRRP